MKPELLDDTATQQAITTLDGWHIKGHELVKEFQFPEYLAGIAFANQVAHLADAMNHHPDIYVGWKKVTLHISTHSVGGLTDLDFSLARKTDTLKTSM